MRCSPDPGTPRHVVRATSRHSSMRIAADLLGFGEPATPTLASADGPIRAATQALPAADGHTVLVQTSYGLVPIGWVQSVLKVLDDAPNQRKGAPRAWIRFDEQVAEGAKDLRPGDEIVVLTWLHLSPRDELSTHPEDERASRLPACSAPVRPTGRTPSACTVPASWPATGFGLKSTLWRQSTGRRWWTSSRPSTRPHGRRTWRSCTATYRPGTVRPGRTGDPGRAGFPRSAHRATPPWARAPRSRRTPCARSSRPWRGQPEGP